LHHFTLLIARLTAGSTAIKTVTVNLRRSTLGGQLFACLKMIVSATRFLPSKPFIAPISPSRYFSTMRSNRLASNALIHGVLAFSLLGHISAEITLVSQAKGYLGSDRTKITTTSGGSTLLSYDATGVSKLVVAIGFESGFNGNSATVTGVKFNNVALTQAVQENTFGNTSYDGGTVAIYYLDNPFQGAATFTFSYTTSGGGPNGGFASILGLSGTGSGIGNTSKNWYTQAAPGNVSTSITTTAFGSMVIAAVENSGRNNGAGTPTAISPLTLGDSDNWSNYGSVASGYQLVPDAGTTITPTFNTAAGGNIHVAAVELKPPVSNQYWDVNDTTAGAGGPTATGTWSAAGTRWNAVAEGIGPAAAWSAGANAVFAAGSDATGSYTVTVDGAQDITGLTFEEGNVTLANGTAGSLRLSGNTPANVTAGLSATVATPLDEDSAGRQLVKIGPGTLVLSGNNSYTGITGVAAGTLVLSGNNVAATGGMILNGGVTQFDSPASVNGTARDVTLNAGGTVVFGTSFAAGNIPSGLARIVSTSSGVIAADNYNATNLDFNTAGLTAACLGAVGSVSYTGTLTPNGTTYRLGGGGGTLTMANTNAVTGAGNSLIVRGNVNLTGSNNHGGGTTLTSGTLAVGNDVSLGSGTLTINGGTIQSADSAARVLANALALGSDVTVGGTGNLTFSNTSATALGATRTFTINNPSSTFARAFSGTNFGITKAGTGALTLSGNNSYTGLTTVTAGTLTLSGNNTGTGGVTLTAGTLNINHDHALGNSGALTITTGTIDNTKGSAVANSVATPVTIGGNFTFGSPVGTANNNLNLGTGAVTNAGNRTITLNGTATTLTLGGVMTNTSNAVQTTTVNGAGNTLVLGGYALSNNATSRVNIITGTGNVTITGPVTNGGTATASGLTKQGTGTLTLNGANTYKGPTTVSAGTLALGQATLDRDATVTVASGAVLRLDFAGENQVVNLVLNGVTQGVGVYNSTTAAPYITGAGSLRVITLDADGDGMTDAFELAYTTPPSATAMNPGDDLDNDGQTNLQEYQRGTLPNNPDTDGDTLQDGAEVAGAGSRPPTDPLKTDTDGDTLGDLAENNTGTWVNATSTGTNPTSTDTDADALRDNFETNTGTNVSATNTGTNPLLADTDNDGAGDWYEITASFTNPFAASSKPNIPYPLPDPDGSTGAPDKPVKVYIMSGQSNMVGFGTVSASDSSALTTMTRTENKFPNLIDGAGNFIARQDVRYRGVIAATGNAPLAPGFGADSNKFGPELGFGQVMGWFHDAPVLLLKSSQGNRSLGWDFLPPGSQSYVYGSTNYPGYGGFGTWPVGGQPPTSGSWYAGLEYDECFLNEADMHPNAATMVGTRVNVVDVLDNWATDYAATGKPFAGHDFQIAGFVWWQGDKDRYDMALATRYELNLVNFISSLRNYYSNRYPGKVVANAPFVLATLGQTAIGDTTPASDVAILDAQLAMNDTVKYPQFAGNVKTVYSHPLSEGGASNSHYNGRAGTYMLVGDALGRAMVDLESAAQPASDYLTWAGLYPGNDLTNPNADLDGDGQTNNQERVWGLNPTSGASSNPISVPYNPATGTLTYTRRYPALNTGVSYSYQWTDSLAQGSWQNFTPANVSASGASPVESVTITLPAGLLANPKLFVRVVGTSN
jgi:autotransporter-associated beta strand protein